MKAHILDKQISISCGSGTQRVKWLGHVAIARWDEKELQGWKSLGKGKSSSSLLLSLFTFLVG